MPDYLARRRPPADDPLTHPLAVAHELRYQLARLTGQPISGIHILTLERLPRYRTIGEYSPNRWGPEDLPEGSVELMGEEVYGAFPRALVLLEDRNPNIAITVEQHHDVMLTIVPEDS